jgi:hypothetical protein
VIADSEMAGLAFGASVQAATIEANQKATVQAIVGQSAQISGGSGGITIDADHDGDTYVDAAALGVALGVSVAIVRATANHNATVKALVMTGASLTASGGSTILINADHNDGYANPADDPLPNVEGALATANKSNFAILGAVGDSVTKAHAKIVVETTVESGTTFSTPGGAIIVTAGGRNLATATLKSVSAAIVRIDSGKAGPVAEGRPRSTPRQCRRQRRRWGSVVAGPGVRFTYAFGSMNASVAGSSQWAAVMPSPPAARR